MIDENRIKQEIDSYVNDFELAAPTGIGSGCYTISRCLHSAILKDGVTIG